MFDMTAYAEVSGLLEQVAALEERLSPNERELYRSLKAKYAEPGHTSFDDKTCLEVILRNVGIRKAHGQATGANADRVIDLQPRRGAKDH